MIPPLFVAVGLAPFDSVDVMSCLSSDDVSMGADCAEFAAAAAAAAAAAVACDVARRLLSDEKTEPRRLIMDMRRTDPDTVKSIVLLVVLKRRARRCFRNGCTHNTTLTMIM